MEQRSKVRGLCAFTYSASMYSRIQDIREWRRVEIGSQETEVASVMSTQFMEDSHYRIVVQRTKEKDSTLNLFGDRYTYRCIITNAKSATRTKSFRLGGLTFGKINPEVLFYGASGRIFMLLGVLPDSKK